MEKNRLASIHRPPISDRLKWHRRSIFWQHLSNDAYWTAKISGEPEWQPSRIFHLYALKAIFARFRDAVPSVTSTSNRGRIDLVFPTGIRSTPGVRTIEMGARTVAAAPPRNRNSISRDTSFRSLRRERLLSFQIAAVRRPTDSATDSPTEPSREPHTLSRRAAPRHATPRHATPRHATPRHATPRQASDHQ